MQVARVAQRRFATVSTLMLAAVFISGCQSESLQHKATDRIASDPNERFTEADYGVKASPRVTDLRQVRKGGGREQIGRPYKVRGKWYYPKEQPGYIKVGNASWYGASFHGRLTANGEVYDMFGLSAAHPTFPLPSYARVTNVETGANLVVRVNDRGPYVADRMMDLSSRAAEMLGYKADGVGRIKVEYVGKAPLEGDDTPTLVASYHPGNIPSSINDGLASGVLLAMNEAPAKRDRFALGSSSSSRSLPGVRAVADTPSNADDATSIDAIIKGVASTPTARQVPVSLPTRRSNPAGLIVTSYATQPVGVRTGAAAAIAALSHPALEVSRIELGIITDTDVLAVVREIATKHGRLIAEADAGTTTYALDVAANDDIDAVLQTLWQAGASDAFVVRD